MTVRVHLGHVVETCGDTRNAKDLESFMEKVASPPPDPAHERTDRLLTPTASPE